MSTLDRGDRAPKRGCVRVPKNCSSLQYMTREKKKSDKKKVGGEEQKWEEILVHRFVRQALPMAP